MQGALAAGGQTLVVGDQNQRGAVFAVKVKQQIGDLLAGGGVQVTGRLVGKQNGRLTGKGTGNGNPLLFAARQLLRIMADTRLEADALK